MNMQLATSAIGQGRGMLVPAQDKIKYEHSSTKIMYRYNIYIEMFALPQKQLYEYASAPSTARHGATTAVQQ